MTARATSAVARIHLRKRLAPKELRRPSPAPIVKWAGGKSKLLAELISRQPTAYRRYFEPFAGGAALLFRLGPQDAVVSDLNPALINMYRCVAWNVEAVIRRLQNHRRKHDEDYYYAMRDRWNQDGFRGDVDRAAAFIYLNKTCYNGLWRVNSKGEFNVPVGRYESPQIFQAAQLRASALALQKCDIRCSHYAEVLEQAEAGDFVYLDPPYHPVTATANFTSYTVGNFGESEQRDLARVARRLKRRKCHVMLSNSDTTFVRTLYKGFRIERVSCARAINSKAKRRGPVGELIITS